RLAMPNGISAQIQLWRDQLLDTSKRNRLIHFRTGRGGGVALVFPDPGDLWQRLVIDGRVVTFAWQRDLIDLPKARATEEVPSVCDPEEPLPMVKAGAQLERCRRSSRLRDDQVLTDLPDVQLASRLARLALHARESLSEQGVITLHVAFGFLRWF